MSTQKEVHEMISQEEIEKAISMEEKVFEQLSKERRYGKTYSQRSQSPTINSTPLRTRRNTHDSVFDGIVSAPNNSTPQYQQRYPDITNNCTISAPLPFEISKTPPDLISFSTDPPKNPTHSSFEQLIKDLQKIPTMNIQTAPIPLGPTAALPNLTRYYNPPPITAHYPILGAAAGMQVVPYTPPPPNAPLTKEVLQELYRAPPPPPMGFVAPICYPPYAPSVPRIGGVIAVTPSAGYMQHPFSYGHYNNNKIPTHAPSPQNYSAAASPEIATPSNFTTATLTLPNTADYASANGGGSYAGNISFCSFGSSSGFQTGSRNISPPRKQTGGDLMLDDDSHGNVLEIFDPLHNKDDTGNNSTSDVTVYQNDYPFEVLYGGTQYTDPLYNAVINSGKSVAGPKTLLGWKQECFPSDFSPSKPFSDGLASGAYSETPPPLPPRNTCGSEERFQSELGLNDGGIYPRLESRILLDRRKTCNRLYETVTNQSTIDRELLEFYNMVKKVRGRYLYTDEKTNVGHVVASEFKYQYPPNTSIKIIVHPELKALLPNTEAASSQRGSVQGYGAPVTFTCDIETDVQFIINQAFCSLEGQIRGSIGQFAVKPIGVSEWLSPSSTLSQLECIHNILKLEKDVQLGLCLKSLENMNVIARTQQDDERDANLRPEDILPNEMGSPISYDEMKILLETLEAEIDRLESSAASEVNARSLLSCLGVKQAVKAICTLLGSIETLEIAECIADLKRICDESQPKYNTHTSLAQTNPEIISDCGDYAEVSLRPRSTLEQIKLKCNQLRDGVQQLVSLYATVFRVKFSVKQVDYTTTPIPISRVLTPIVTRIDCLHRLPLDWKYDEYSLGVQIVYGTRYISDPEVTTCSIDTKGGLFPRLNFSTWLRFDKNPICTLPREARLIFVIYGKKAVENEPNTVGEPQTQTELGWCAIQLFDYQREMVCGPYLLSVWPKSPDKFLGSAPARGCHPQPEKCAVLSIEIPPYGGRIQFPAPLENPPPAQRYDFRSLDNNLQQELQDIAKQGFSGALDKREVFWEKRFYLQSFPDALPKVLHAAHSWDYASVMDLHSLLHSWSPLSPAEALSLLHPIYPDERLRKKAVDWISALPNDQLVDYLPQLLQALKYDTYEASSMARFLLCKCLESPRIAHHSYWLIVHSLPGDDPQNSIDASFGAIELDESQILQSRYYRRNKLMLRALLAICGEKLSERFLTQSMMCKELGRLAVDVQTETKGHRRKHILIFHLEDLHRELQSKPTSLPLSPEMEITGVNVGSSSYFHSKTTPLKISFIGPDFITLPAIFKYGDDLQKDMLTIQLIRLMNKMWLAGGLDLKIVTFNCVPTGDNRGMIEMITEAETLRNIQDAATSKTNGTGIAQWLQKQNPSQLEYQRAVRNFTVSCAGYCVATYILGIGDRHNENIMIKTSGHFFHIDFGKFLGDVQKFAFLNRDRVPFVFTREMAYVINGGTKASRKFQKFVDLCCDAFKIVRKHGDLIMNMLAFMAKAGITGVNSEALKYVHEALHPGQSDCEATVTFYKLIHNSLSSWFPVINFRIHDMANPSRNPNGVADEKIFSFCPKTYTLKNDGLITNVHVSGIQKHTVPEKFYSYILSITYKNQPDPINISRTYNELQELELKLREHFPTANLYNLPNNWPPVGRTNKATAEGRLCHIKRFLHSVLQDSPDEVAHSDLIYTFFHPVLRDQPEVISDAGNGREVGQLEISFQYVRDVFIVMIYHAKDLPTFQGQEPNTYVKCYLKPDINKKTKRKTKVVTKTCFPTFMELFEYRMPLEDIQTRSLHVSVVDKLRPAAEQLGEFYIDLSERELHEEVKDWFRLDNRVSRNYN